MLRILPAAGCVLRQICPKEVTWHVALGRYDSGFGMGGMKHRILSYRKTTKHRHTVIANHQFRMLL